MSAKSIKFSKSESRRSEPNKNMKELIDKISAGEDSFTEFKNEQFHNESLAKEIVAFSNMKGGTIWIGIEDNGTITGVKEQKIEERIINICRNSVEPSVLPDIKTYIIEDNKRIIELIIPKGDYKPYKVKGQNRVFIRVGSISIEPSIPELVRLLQSGGQFHFEVSSIPDTDLSDFDALRFREYCEKYRNTSFEESSLITLIQNLQLMDREQNLTIAGMLFFGNTTEMKLMQAGIQLIHFEGEDKTQNIIDQKEANYTIPECIETTIKFVQNNSKVKGLFKEESHLRQDIREYDPFTVRELIANAFCHRDWSIFGQKIRLLMFSNRLEIFSPGGLPNTLNLQNALSGVCYYRNNLIAQICRDYGIVEKIGRGLEKIMRRSKELNLPFPKFECELEYVKVILPKNV